MFNILTSWKCKLRFHLIPFSIATMKKKKQMRTDASMDSGKECLFAFAGNANWYNLFGNQCIVSSKRWK